MNAALRLLLSLGGYQDKADDGTQQGGGFQPSNVNQGSGLHNGTDLSAPRMTPQEQQAAQDADAVIPVPESDASDLPAPSPDTPATPEADTPAPEGEETKYTYKGQEVSITPDPEVEAMFSESQEKLGDLTLDAVNKELYSEAGLTAETRAKLDEAFGKASVSMYLKGWEAQQDLAIHQQETYVKEFKSMANEATGNKLDDVLKWANDKLDPSEYTRYANMVNSGDVDTARLALQDLTRRSGINAPAPASAPSPRPASPPIMPTGGSSLPANDGPITAAEYQKAIVSREYYKNQSKWDARRNAGLAAGI